MTPTRTRRARTLGIATGALLAATALPAVAAQASTADRWPGPVSGVHVSARTATSFTVGLDIAAYASWYRVEASTDESDIWIANLDRPSTHRIVTGAAKPSIVVRTPGYTAATYYYRVATINGSHVRWSSAYHQTHLAPATPTALTGVSGAAGTYLSWDSPTTTGFGIEQATNSSFTTGDRVYTTANSTQRFTPYGLSRGSTYWFRVRSINGATVSPYSGSVAVTVASSERPLRVLTYNVLSATFDGSAIGGSTQAPWSQRRAEAVALLKQSGADVFAVQEGAAVVNAAGDRQVDSIATGLGTGYAIANTDHGSNPGQVPNSRYTGNYILYNRATVTPYGTGGHWMIGYLHKAAYHLFRDDKTGAKFLFLGTHLTSPRGPSYDLQRRAETINLITLARAYAAANQVTSIVYGGDINSWPGRYLTTDMPGNQMKLNKTSDAFQAAQAHSNAGYSSINSYLRYPPMGGSADRLFVTGGVAVRDWGQLLHVYGGAFVGVIPSDHNPVYADIVLPY